MYRLIPTVVPLACSLLALWPTAAEACGGTFCDGNVPNVPMPMAVDQTGENILFILDKDQVEVHIQIQYDPNTDAQDFAWLVPLPAVPQFEVGSDLLFRELLRATVPTYGLNTTNEFCPAPDPSGGASTSGASGDPPPDTTGGDTGGGVDVVVQETVGAFDIVVLAAKSAPEVSQWLGDNGFQPVPMAEPIVQQYLDEGNVLVAFKLATGAGLSSIHPIVLRYAGNDGCVPIRLTRIAAVDDMDIRVFALAEARAIPTNYRHVLVNPLKIDWLNYAFNYKEVISLAVDAFGADGHAFVTEFAGPSWVADIAAFYSPDWSEGAFVGLPAIEVVDQLNAQGLMSCFDSFDCAFKHPLIEGLLATHLPVPNGVPPGTFYSALASYEAMIDKNAWGDGSAFAKDLLTRVIDPGLHAATLTTTWPYLTRLYTTISPNEMTVDPLFFFNPDLPDIDNFRIADEYITCDNYTIVTLPDGRKVNIPPFWGWPDFQAEMPWEEDVQQMPPMGMPQPLIDNTALINALLDKWNKSHPVPSPPTTTGDPTTGDPSGTGGTSTSDGTITSGGPDASGGGLTAPGATSEDAGSDSTPQVWGGNEGGCGCVSDPRPGPAGLLALLGLLAVRPRRRARA